MSATRAAAYPTELQELVDDYLGELRFASGSGSEGMERLDEAVETAKELCSTGAPSFLNGILGAVQREAATP